MRMIKEQIECLNDEIESAQEYAEKYVEQKAKGNITRANKFKEMATDELKHCTYLHEMLVKKIEELQKVYTAPVEMLEKWDKEHKVYVEKVAWIKQMLTL